jgi:hypothetical protein
VDPGGEQNGGAWASERVYRVLMRAYPQEVRLRYAEEMVRYFGDLCREEWRSRGPMGVALLWARTLPDLLFTALEERGAVLQRNAYLPVEPGIVARWGALCALLGGSLGVAYHLIGYFLFRGLHVLTGEFYGDDPFTRFFTLSLFLCALSLSSLGLFGLYGAVVQRSGRPGLLAGAGAVFSAGSAALWLATSGYAAVNELASGSALFAPFEWLWNTGTFVIPNALLFWFVGFLLLGIAAVRQPLPVRLRVLPLALFALIMPSYLLGVYFGTQVGPSVTATIVMSIAPGLPFVGITLLGWVLLKGHDADVPLAVMVAFEPERRLELSQKHRFRLEVPLVESAVVPLGQKRPPPEPFEGGPFVFEFEITVQPVPVVELNQKATAAGVTLTLERVMNSIGRPRAVICYEPPDAQHHWFLHGGKGTYEGGWGSSGSMQGVPPADCQTLLLAGPLEGRSSVEVAVIEGMPVCPEGNAEAAEACYAKQKEKMIRGPWRFYVDVT